MLQPFLDTTIITPKNAKSTPKAFLQVMFSFRKAAENIAMNIAEVLMMTAAAVAEMNFSE